MESNLAEKWINDYNSTHGNLSDSDDGRPSHDQVGQFLESGLNDALLTLIYETIVTLVDVSKSIKLSTFD